jgi:hypothetical protein
MAIRAPLDGTATMRSVTQPTPLPAHFVERVTSIRDGITPRRGASA